MPELPEVEIVCRELNNKILNLKIIGSEKSGFSLRKPIDINDKYVNN